MANPRTQFKVSIRLALRLKVLANRSQSDRAVWDFVRRMKMKLIDLTGERFGKLVVLGRADSKTRRTMWLCKCDCGRESTIDGGNLKAGRQSSCGCIKANKHAAHPLWHIYINIFSRCYNKSNHAFDRYGGRNIVMCQDWKESFDVFVKDIGPRPSLKHSIDRIDSNGNYEPSNCRWATSKIQNRNRRNNVLLTHNGKTQCMTAWAEEVGIAHGLIWVRLKMGWSTEEALSPTKWRRRENIKSK